MSTGSPAHDEVVMELERDTNSPHTLSSHLLHPTGTQHIPSEPPCSQLDHDRHSFFRQPQHAWSWHRISPNGTQGELLPLFSWLGKGGQPLGYYLASSKRGMADPISINSTPLSHQQSLAQDMPASPLTQTRSASNSNGIFLSLFFRLTVSPGRQAGRQADPKDDASRLVLAPSLVVTSSYRILPMLVS